MSDLISRQDAIAIATQEGAYGYISAQELAEMPSAQQWIPCSERLPKKSADVVLVTVIDERRIRDIYLMRCDEVEYAYIMEWISAWMPLPEPYMRGEEE